MNLFIGAHPDDIEIHCAGTMLKLRDMGEQVVALILTDGGARDGNRVEEQKKVFRAMGVTGGIWDYKDGAVSVDADSVALVDRLVELWDFKRVFVHSPDDLHQDHVATSRLFTIANRHKTYDLYYYPPTDVTRKFDTNVFVDITEYYERKMEILKMFESQQDRWYMQTEHLVPFAKHVERFQVEFMKGIQ